MRHISILAALLLGVLMLPLSLLGCSGSQGTQTTAPGARAASKSDQEAALARQLKEIDDNPHMPPEAKEAAKANIRQGQNVDLGVHK